ncbi:hypothetical protein [Proteus mirabilis]|uniref:hypothetical protein n=1 Tax=Proteus mirabilis TaxID=584 RepID=UPI001F0679E2|nr:hypothetical protein [Proteus mirabilis]
MRIECYSWSDVSEQILEQAIALQNSAFEDMKGNFYQVDIPYLAFVGDFLSRSKKNDLVLSLLLFFPIYRRY